MFASFHEEAPRSLLSRFTYSFGFVGAIMAAVVADSTDTKGKSRKFVIGMQRPSPRSFWKIHLLNRGLSPVKSEGPGIDVLINRRVCGIVSKAA